MAKNGKEGSALLIVLGFLSFMIVSAVAFSIYMRAERLPSSALRRTVATRQLAKAALAEAIARIDDAVRGSPFPGLNDSDSKGYQPRGVTENHWEGRVFMPPNPDSSLNANQRYYAPAPQTVSVLTLEGLGYVPPPLVNDARFLGRSTWTAAWENLPYDAGRFAFVALNVSDYFDVNRLYANKPRTSNAEGRISLAYLLDQEFRPLMNNTGGESTSVDRFQDGSTSQFDQLVHDQREAGNDKNSVGKDAPFVSLLDYQLSLKTGITGVMPSLFYNWIEQKGVDKVFFTVGDANLQAAGRQPFVTESVATNESYDVDIAYYQAPTGKKQKGQPFDKEVAQDSTTFVQIFAKSLSSSFFAPLQTAATTAEGSIKFATSPRELTLISSVMYDYLDHNDIPLSLAWPCVERVPMFASIEPLFKIKVPQIEATPVGADQAKWEFDPNRWLDPGSLNALWAFPFKRNEAERNDSYKAQAIVRFFLAPEGLSLRAAEGLGKLLRPRSEAEWKQKVDMFKVGNQRDVFCLTFVLDERPIQLPSSVKTEEQAGGLVQFPLNISSVGNLQKVPLVTRKQEKDPVTKQDVYKYTVNVSPLALNGEPMFKVGEVIDQAQFNSTANIKLRPYIAVWLRIVNGNNTVDLVPAVMEDDQLLNNGNSTVPVISQYLLQEQHGPLLRFTGSASFSYADMVNSQPTAAQNEWAPKSFSALDPRFNWAPEDWYTTEEGITTDFQKWLDKTNNYLSSKTADDRGCDYDIFCAVSNQGFLQSLGEFAFLPRLTDPYNGGIARLAQLGSGGYDGVERKNPEDIANKNCAWCSYEMNYEIYEALNQVGIGRSTSNECLVNPYTPERDILMAALANTPCDYWAAGVALDEKTELKSQLGDKELPKIKTASEGLRYAFCENKSLNGQARIKYKELENIAGAIQNAFQNEGFLQEGKQKVCSHQASDAWKYIWHENLNWWPDRTNPDFHQFLGTTLDEPLYGIDRKFLNSYWRDCFGNQQQLFLIFVRAESSAIGGPGEGTPAQKGARAVALVWRNPVATSDTTTGPDGNLGDKETGRWVDDRRPHQTRILFYHQFD